MLRFATVAIFISLAGIPGFTQNLVPNPSFEDYSALPDNYGQIGLALPWMPFFTSSEYFHSQALSPLYSVPINAFGYQYPHSGEAYAGMAFCNQGNAREYIEVRLKHPLDSFTTYSISFYVSFYDWIPQFSIKEFTAHFTADTFRQDNGLPTPQFTPYPQFVNKQGHVTDTSGWTRIEGQFTAEGGEQYLTIGCHLPSDSISLVIFPTDTHPHLVYPACYYIDDVAVWDSSIPTFPALAGGNRRVCVGKEIQLGWYEADHHNYEWSLSPDFDSIFSTEARPWINAVLSSWYYLRVKDFTFQESVDSCFIRVEDCFEFDAPNVFTPNYDGYNDMFQVELPDGLSGMLEVFNRWGQLVFTGDAKAGWDGRMSNGEPNIDGVYFYVLTIWSPEINLKRAYTGSVSLFR